MSDAMAKMITDATPDATHEFEPSPRQRVEFERRYGLPWPGMRASPDEWRPASGYTTPEGKSKWRCWNESRMPNGSNPAGGPEYERADGRVWLCDTFDAAQRKCDELNALRASPIADESRHHARCEAEYAAPASSHKSDTEQRRERIRRYLGSIES